MYKLTYKIFETKKQAEEFCKEYNKKQSYYMRKNKPAEYTRRSGCLWVCWFYW